MERVGGKPFRAVRTGDRILLLLLLALLLTAGPLQARELLEVKVEGEGVEGEALENVQAALTPPAGLGEGDRLDRQWVERFARQSPQRAVEALKPFGYYKAEVESNLQTDDRGYLLKVTIRPGDPVRLERVRVTVTGPGAREEELRDMIDLFPLDRRDVLRQDLYEKAKSELKAAAVDLGFLDAEYEKREIRIDLDRNRAEIELALATGPQYRFGPILLHGTPDFPERFLRRYIAFREGDPFSYPRLGQTQLNYLDSDRFEEVLVTPRPELASDRKVPVNIQLVPSARRRLRPGIGYGTDTGARVTLRYKDVNLFHRGHEFSALFNIGERLQSLSGEYIVPSYRKLSDHTALRSGYEREDVDAYETSTYYVEAERVRALGRNRLGSVYVRLQQEDYTIGEEDSRSRLILPGLRFSERRYDDLIRPTQGYQYRLEVRGAHQALGSDTGLLQALGSADAMQPLPGRLSLILRVQAGATWQNEPLREIPPSIRFFAGGDRSVRGYAYQSLGPRDASGEVVGGKNLLVGSVELERALGSDWGVSAFYDAGNAFDSFYDYEIFEGAGLGIRRHTPVGPIKVDLARQVGVPDPSFRLHVSIGFAW